MTPQLGWARHLLSFRFRLGACRRVLYQEGRHGKTKTNCRIVLKNLVHQWDGHLATCQTWRHEQVIHLDRQAVATPAQASAGVLRLAQQAIVGCQRRQGGLAVFRQRGHLFRCATRGCSSTCWIFLGRTRTPEQ